MGFLDFVFALAVVMSVMLVISGIVTMQTYHIVPAGVHIENQTIYSIELGSSVHGSFFLGSGNVNGKACYYYYTLEDNGGYTLNEIPTEDAQIFMDINGNETPYIEIVSAKSTSCSDRFSVEDCVKYDHYLQRKYNIHVPQGAIVQRYNAMVTP